MRKKLSVLFAAALLVCGLPVEPVHATEMPQTTEQSGNIEVYNVNEHEEMLPQAIETTTADAERYDPRGTSLITSVKNQENFDLCSTFGMASMIESSLIKQGLADNTVDLSELQIAYMDVYLDFMKKGKTYNYEQMYLAMTDTSVSCNKFKDNGWGFVLESDMPYSLIREESSFDTWNERANRFQYKIKRLYTAEPHDVPGIKKLIANYGAVTMCYQDSNMPTPHAVGAVGWDNAHINEDGSVGAWLCKNSWGTVIDSGYKWLAYNREELDGIYAVVMTADVNEELQLSKEYTMTVGESISIMDDVKPYRMEGEEITFQNWLDQYVSVSSDGIVTALKETDAKWKGDIWVKTESEVIAQLTFVVNPTAAPDPTPVPVVTPAPQAAQPLAGSTPKVPQQVTPQIQQSVAYTNPYRVIQGETSQFYYVTDTAGNLTITKGKNVSNITIPNLVEIDGWTYLVTDIQPDAFSNLKTKSVTIKATKLQSLSSKVFSNCKQLKTVTLSKTGITKVSKNAFSKCHKKLKVKVIGTLAKSKDKTVKAVKAAKLKYSYSKK